jgi:hypothetical protein
LTIAIQHAVVVTVAELVSRRVDSETFALANKCQKTVSLGYGNVGARRVRQRSSRVRSSFFSDKSIDKCRGGFIRTLLELGSDVLFSLG